jgi:outer membrane lipoprotein-sorting protein
MMRAVLAIAAVIAPAIASAQPTKPIPAADALAKIEAAYKQPKQLTAQVEQSVFNEAMGTTATSKGTVYIVKPDKMNWEYVDKKGKQSRRFVFDGKLLWAIEPQNLQAYMREPKTSALPGVVGFFLGGGTLSKEFTVAYPKATSKHVVPGGTTLLLTPKQTNAEYSEIYLVADPTSWTVTRVTTVNSSGVATTYVFRNIDTKTAIDAAKFVWDPKAHPNYKIIK